MRAEAIEAGIETWRAKPGPAQAKLLASRLKDYPPSDLALAVRGYVRRHGLEPRGDFDPRAHFTAESILRPKNIDANIEASSRPESSPPSRRRTYADDVSDQNAETLRQYAADLYAEPDGDEPVPLFAIPGGER